MIWTKAKKKAPKLTERDMQVPGLLEEYKLLTTSQVQQLVYPTLQKAQTRLLRLFQAGEVKRFAYPVLLREGGKGEYVYHLKRGPKTVLTAVQHMLGLNDLRIAFEQACGSSDGIKLVEFIPEYKGVRRLDGRPGRAVEDSVAVREGVGTEGILIPDAVICLGNTATGKQALFFLELDLGTEKLVSLGRGHYSLLKKMLLYREYLNTSGFERYNDMFKYEFKGFRVLTIMNNASRIRRLRAELTQRDIRKFVWFAVADKVTRDTILDKIWIKADKEDNGQYSIIYK